MSWRGSTTRSALRLGTVLAVFGAAIPGCADEAPARDQWRVVIATDAPVPQFGDRLSIEIISSTGGVCTGCSRVFSVSDATAWPVSFGVLPPDEGTVALRATLYRAVDVAEDGGPASTSVIDSMYELPEPTGITDVSIVLSMDCFGVPVDPVARASCEPSVGQSGPIRVATFDDALPEPGSWPPAATVPCDGALEPGMQCVEGGVFLLGYAPGFRIDPLIDPVPERLVRLSAFALDEREVAVQDILPLVEDEAISATPRPHDPDANAKDHNCTWGASDSGLPVNCVARELAAEICHAQGKRLPTEAEWEFAAGGRTVEAAFPWGAEQDVCGHALVAYGLKSPFITPPEDVTCSGTLKSTHFGPSVVGHPGDVSPLGLYNLAGNVSEWVADDHALYSDPCWAPDSRLLLDPQCLRPDATHAVYRGASYAAAPIVARVYVRGPAGDQGGPNVGIRCAKSM